MAWPPSLPIWLSKPPKKNLSHEAYLYELAKHEEEQRTQRRTARLLRSFGLPAEKTFRTFDLERSLPALATAGGTAQERQPFSRRATNVIAVGKPGVGKSHVAAAVGYELILQGHAVLWTPHGYPGAAPASRQAGSAAAPGTGQTGQVCLRHPG